MGRKPTVKKSSPKSSKVNIKKVSSEKKSSPKPKGPKISILVDDRERKVIPFFEEFDKEVSVGRITTGDYAIMVTEPKKKPYPLVIFERKSWKDFSDSFKTNRFENNKNLYEFRDKYKCRIIFILEGQAFPAPTRKFSGIPHKNIQAKIDHMMLVDGFQMIQTQNCKMTAKRIIDIANSCEKHFELIRESTLKTSYSGSSETEESGSESDESGSSEDSEAEFVIPDAMKKVRHKTNDRVLLDMWISLPQVSNLTAKVLSEKWSISELVSGKVFARDIAELTYPSGTRIGEKRAKQILVIANEVDSTKTGGNVVTLKKAIEFKKAQTKLLSSIHGVSKITATEICKKYTLKQLCQTVVEKDLALVKRSPKANARNVGPALAKKILDLLRTKNV